MGPSHKYRESGGGPATGLANDFVGWLQNALQTGSFGAGTAGARFNGANPGGSTGGIGDVLNSLLSGGAGNIGGAYTDMISKQGERDVNALRSRFGASGGTAFGTPAAYGEALLRSETAPKMTAAVGGLQLGALQSLLPIFAGLSQKGITQREGYLEPSGFASLVQGLAPLISAGAGFMTGNPLAAAPMMGGGAPSVSSNFLTSSANQPWWNPSGGPSPLAFGRRQEYP